MIRLLGVFALAGVLGLAVSVSDVCAQAQKGKGKGKQKGVNVEKIFKAIDKNGDMKVSKEEYKTFLEKTSKRIAKQKGEEAAEKMVATRLAIFEKADSEMTGLNFEAFEKMMKAGQKGKKKKDA